MGCAAFTALGLYLSLVHHSNTWTAGANVALAVIFLLLAAFRVWQDEHAEFLRVTQQPNLLIKVNEVFIIASEMSDVFIHASVHNDSNVNTLIDKARILVDVPTQKQPYILEGPFHDLGAFTRTTVDWNRPEYRIQDRRKLEEDLIA
jgi:hypothetical protein